MELLRKMLTSRISSRRFFLASVSVVIGGLVFLKRKWFGKPAHKAAIFLTRDGKLVEVALDKLPVKKVAIAKDRLVSWIWKHQKL